VRKAKKRAAPQLPGGQAKKTTGETAFEYGATETIYSVQAVLRTAERG
jgi:hypothetical protein